MIRRFTGWHMTAIMVAFFGVVVTVNLVMATFATRTFGGTVVDNSYVASQNFNRWLREAREQDQLQWRIKMSASEDERLMLQLAAPGGPLDEATPTVTLSHPLGRQAERPMTFLALGGGNYRSLQPLPSGRWIVRLTVKRAGQEARFVEELER